MNPPGNKRKALGWLAAAVVLAGGCQNGWRLGPLWNRPAGEANSEEEWTILCLELRDANHRTVAERLAEALRAVKGLDPKAVRVEHTDEASRITYGRYRKHADPKTGELTFPDKFRREINLIRHLAAGKRFPFAEALPVLIRAKSVGPPEWDVHNARGPYTLQIAVFFNTATFRQRRQAAVQYVQQLREQGFEAYYWHQDARSLVFVGNFPSRPERLSPDRQRILAEQEAATLVARNEEFRYMTFNGYPHRTRTVTGRWVRDTSLLVEVPRREEPAGGW